MNILLWIFCAPLMILFWLMGYSVTKDKPKDVPPPWWETDKHREIYRKRAAQEAERTKKRMSKKIDITSVQTAPTVHKLRDHLGD